MPIHDWTKVPAGVFHDFHHAWIEDLKRVLNNETLPGDFYAMAEQRTADLGPDVLTLHDARADPVPAAGTSGAVAILDAPPKVRHRSRMSDAAWYAVKADRIVVRHVTGDRVIAVIELMSPGNKAGKEAIRDFVEKRWRLLRAGIHLIVVDLFPPTSRDPHGIHDLIWDDAEDRLERPPGMTLTCAAYKAGPDSEAFVEPVGVGSTLPDMPLFLNPHQYVPVPLERSYQLAWEGIPLKHRRQL